METDHTPVTNEVRESVHAQGRDRQDARGYIAASRTLMRVVRAVPGGSSSRGNAAAVCSSVKGCRCSAQRLKFVDFVNGFLSYLYGMFISGVLSCRRVWGYPERRKASAFT